MLYSISFFFFLRSESGDTYLQSLALYFFGYLDKPKHISEGGFQGWYDEVWTGVKMINRKSENISHIASFFHTPLARPFICFTLFLHAKAYPPI